MHLATLLSSLTQVHKYYNESKIIATTEGGLLSAALSKMSKVRLTILQNPTWDILTYLRNEGNEGIRKEGSK